jgi:hypothetical protein
MAAGDTVKCARFWTMARSKQLACQACVKASIGVDSYERTAQSRHSGAGRSGKGAPQATASGPRPRSHERASKIDGRQKKNRRWLTRWARSGYW